MSIGTLELSIVSASISPNTKFDFEPSDTYATVRCIKEQRTTKTARDQGRFPAWHETFTFNLQDEDTFKEILVQVFSLGSEVDELLGVARIPIATAIRMPEGTLCSLYSPSKGETGKLRIAWKWKPTPQWNGEGTSPHNFNDVIGAMANLAVDKGYSGKSMAAAPPFNEYRSSTPPNAMPAYPQSTAVYSSYPDYPGPTSSSNYPQISQDKTSAYTTTGIGETKEKGTSHDSNAQYAYPRGYPSAPYSAGYPPASYPPPSGYRPAYPPTYGHPPGSYRPAPVYPAPAYPPAPIYPPAPVYPPAQHGYPPAPHGYSPASGHHSAPAYPPYGHSVGYAGGAYVDHSLHGKHSDQHKDDKHSKHEKSQYVVHGHHHKEKKHKKKHKKNKFFGKGLKFKF